MTAHNSYPRNTHNTRHIPVRQERTRTTSLKVKLGKYAAGTALAVGGVHVAYAGVTAAEHAALSTVKSVGNTINNDVLHRAENIDRANDARVTKAPHKEVVAEAGDGVNDLILKVDPLALSNESLMNAIAKDINNQIHAAGYDGLQAGEGIEVAQFAELQPKSHDK